MTRPPIHVVGAAIMHEGRCLVAQRGLQMSDAGLWEFPGGKVEPQETAAQALTREIEEELGLALAFGSLTYLGTAVGERRYQDYCDREFQDVYAVSNDAPLSQLSLAIDEVDVVYEVPVVRAVELFRDGRYVAASGFDSQRRVNNALLVAEDLPSQGAGVLAEELERVRAWLEGEDPASISGRPFAAG